MFRFSLDSYIASEQQQQADKLLEEICTCCSPQYSKDIENLFENVTFSYLEDFVKIVEQEKRENIIIAAVPRNSFLYAAQRDLKRVFDKLGKSWKEPIPYIEHSFSEDYKVPHGEDYRHCFFFFITQYYEFEASEQCVKYYLSRVNRLKAFL